MYFKEKESNPKWKVWDGRQKEEYKENDHLWMYYYLEYARLQYDNTLAPKLHSLP